MSAKGQLDHMREIRNNLLRSKSIHEVPEYYAVASFSPGEQVRDLSVMEFMKGKKVERLREELAAKKDAESKRRLKQLASEYADFERQIKKRKITLTDIHEGNILTYYNPIRKRYVFVVIDQ
jgi:predicted unusual protein kinase regulating ubiquinone biosynthesis (AarF/ABC1/UbiB family)